MKTQLEQRRAELLSLIQRQLLESDNQNYNDLAGRVHDSAEEAVADLLADIGFADIDREVSEVSDIEQALIRLATGSYGVCIDCEENIPFERLSAYPTAKRCLVCQQHYESGRQTGSHASL
ncbi:TraR/DksA family transcriptional regulator [Thiogranum longum]|uniref:TraR/DksA family transcriptional regulator n=1 Tax=Thiogranum longum TaxID=1537524 RepID=UPI00104EF0C3|nr:TraR/DksA family transcriptional regulator [Thiogranum longum]